MKTRNLLLLILIVLTSYSYANADGIIKGTIRYCTDQSILDQVKTDLLQNGKVIQSTLSNSMGYFEFLGLNSGTYTIKLTRISFEPKSIEIELETDQVKDLNLCLGKKITPRPDPKELCNEMIVECEDEIAFYDLSPVQSNGNYSRHGNAKIPAIKIHESLPNNNDFNTEEYDFINENTFQAVIDHPLSTFSVDVDRASYTNVRRFLNSNQLPPKDAVRIEEFINYFPYHYPTPEKSDAFSVHLEKTSCPWNSENDLLLVGLRGKDLNTEEAAPSNLVFLIDVSGSMNSPNKLPLLINSFKTLVDQLREQDRIAIVVYAGAAGLVLNSTPGNEKGKIYQALNKFKAGGSTAGGAGIRLAYKIARENFIKKGNNRVILATDGDFNVGASSNSEMQHLIEEKRESGIYLSVLGFGRGNLNDAMMENISNAGNGNYAYIDSKSEADKVFGKELFGTLYTIAKDVKIQIEFNPAFISSYRLIGYENRMLKAEDFNDDKKDAGDIGAGHMVTALYELIPAKKQNNSKVDPLEFQEIENISSPYMLNLKLRYKQPDGHTSKLIKKLVSEEDLRNIDTQNIRFASAVAGFGMLLRQSEYSNKLSYDMIIKTLQQSQFMDEEAEMSNPYCQELVGLVTKARDLQRTQRTDTD